MPGSWAAAFFPAVNQPYFFSVLTSKVFSASCSGMIGSSPGRAQEGLYRHFAAAAATFGLSLIVYNVPGRTGVNILPKRLPAWGSKKYRRRQRS